MIIIVGNHYLVSPLPERCTVQPGFSKLFERHKNVYYCQVFTIYHVIYTMIANFGKQQKVWFTNSWSLLSTGLLSPGLPYLVSSDIFYSSLTIFTISCMEMQCSTWSKLVVCSHNKCDIASLSGCRGHCEGGDQGQYSFTEKWPSLALLFQ